LFPLEWVTAHFEFIFHDFLGIFLGGFFLCSALKG
jgi:hypothetical protein